MLVKAREVNSRIERGGGRVLRQRGSHRFYEVVDESGTQAVAARTTLPQHSGGLPIGTLRSIERDLEVVLGKGWLR
ncbi:type II toxin-antitoxin system HicA family toxin [Frondihabitans sp. PAMC 28766]|uniref:type II toxin-antitoxin system HicA family toxin n=1 Tax=Frondihabitans sp. PAMC 28766 TaxID=1795630 RepID=UPI003518BDB1